VTESRDQPSSEPERVGSSVRVVEKHGELTIEIPRVGWDADTGPRVVGGVILLIVVLFRSWVTSLGLPNLPPVLLFGPFPFLGAWLLWRGIERGFVSTRICLSPTGGSVEWTLVGPLRSFVEIDVRTLEVESKRNVMEQIDLRLTFLEPDGRDRRVRILRGHGTVDCDQVGSTIGAWINKHRSVSDETKL
jgi:hypothetical protein